jgi:hypothetical protein
MQSSSGLNIESIGSLVCFFIHNSENQLPVIAEIMNLLPEQHNASFPSIT